MPITCDELFKKISSAGESAAGTVSRHRFHSFDQSESQDSSIENLSFQSNLRLQSERPTPQRQIIQIGMLNWFWIVRSI